MNNGKAEIKRKETEGKKKSEIIKLFRKVENKGELLTELQGRHLDDIDSKYKMAIVFNLFNKLTKDVYDKIEEVKEKWESGQEKNPDVLRNNIATIENMDEQIIVLYQDRDVGLKYLFRDEGEKVEEFKKWAKEALEEGGAQGGGSRSRRVSRKRRVQRRGTRRHI